MAPLLHSPEDLQTSAPSILSTSFMARAAQVSPELQLPALPDVKEDPSAAEISRIIAPRRLSTSGICKVLVVDDSRPNVKIVIRLIKQASSLCPHLSGGNGYNGGGRQGGVVGIEAIRSIAYYHPPILSMTILVVVVVRWWWP